MDPSKSDHVPLLVEIEGVPNQKRRRRRSFCFKNFWADHKECESIIHKAWNQPIKGVPMYQGKKRNTRDSDLELYGFRMMNGMLDMNISNEEVKGHVFQMQPEKALGTGRDEPFYHQKSSGFG
ncbi:hypothetical protein TB1_046168 [Malus domestica]